MNRRTAPRSVTLVTAAVVIACALLLDGCVGEAAREPTLPTVDFRPKLILEVDEAGMHLRAGPRADGSVTVDPPAAGDGTVMTITNTGTADHRVRSEGTFDTGTMRPGETVTVVLSNATDADRTLVVRDTARDGSLDLVVRPRASS